MTVIALDSKSIAVDRQETDGEVSYRCRKYDKIQDKDGNNLIVLITGTSYAGIRFVEFLKGKVEELPTLTEENASSAIVCYCDDKWKIYRIVYYATLEEHVGEEITDYSLPIAWGSGGYIALGAMNAGKSAKEAVLITNKISIHCGYGCDEFSINRERWDEHQRSIR